MPRAKKIVEGVETEEEVTTPEETQPEVAVEESEAKKKYRALIEDYKVKSPGKYALKEKELLAKLNSL